MDGEGRIKAKALPEWLNTPEEVLTSGRPERERRPILERTLHETVHFLDDILFNETVAEKRGFMQKVDARIKIAVVLVLIVVLSFKRGPLEMLPFGILALFLALISRVPPGVFLKRLLPPFLMTSAIALPAAMNIVVKGGKVLTLFHTGGFLGLPPEIYLTKQGLMSAAGLVLRVLISLSLVFLVSFTTKPSRLIKGLGSMLPGFIRTLVGISYRYIFFLVRRLEEFVLAHKARTAGGVSAREARAWAGARAGSLLLIGMELKEDLRMAMEARGMNYELKDTEGAIKPGLCDFILIALGGGLLLI